MLPMGANAAELYLQVLATDPDNAPASAGLSEITAAVMKETQDLLDILTGSHAMRVQKVSELDNDRQVFNALMEGLLQIFAHELRAEKQTQWLPAEHRHQLGKLIEVTLKAQQRARRHGNIKLIAEKLFLHDFPVFNISLQPQ